MLAWKIFSFGFLDYVLGDCLGDCLELNVKRIKLYRDNDLENK